MALSATDTAANYLGWSSVAILTGASSALWGFWINVGSWDASGQNIWHDTTFASAGWRFSRAAATDVIRVTLYAGTNQTIDTAAGFAAAGWKHVGLWAETSGNVRIYVDGVLSDSKVLSGLPFDTHAGTHRSHARSGITGMAELVIWKDPASLAQAEGYLTALTAGFSPLLMPEKPFYYAPHIRHTVTIDRMRGLTSTITGALSSAPHPPIRYPAPRFILGVPAAAPGGLSIPVAMYNYRKRRAG